MPAPESGVYRTPPIYRILDDISGALLLFLIVWAPWAVGSTTAKTIWIVTGVGYALGILLLCKKFFCRRFSFDPVRWVDDGGWPTKVMAILSSLLILYVVASLVNKRAIAVYTHNAPDPNQITGVDLQTFETVPWLPSSYDWPRTMNALFRYIGVGAMFWAARDWLAGKSRAERHRSNNESGDVFPNARAKIALWTLSLSATALAMVGIIQRFDHTPKLLWMIEHRNPADFTFGPFPYRGNGAQYLNLIIPVTLGFWWALREQAGRRAGVNRRAGGDAHVMLIPCVILMAAGTSVTTSRGGFGIMVMLLICATMILATARRATAWLRVSLLATLVVATAVGLVLGGENLKARFLQMEGSHLGGRGEVYEVSHRMAQDFHVLGSGAETFSTLFGFYRINETGVWAAYAHNDWLETLITFGWVGGSIIYALLLLLPIANQFGSGVPANREFRALLFLSLAGLLAHAAFDFPFQIYGIVYSFTFLAAVATLATRR